AVLQQKADRAEAAGHEGAPQQDASDNEQEFREREGAFLLRVVFGGGPLRSGSPRQQRQLTNGGRLWARNCRAGITRIHADCCDRRRARRWRFGHAGGWLKARQACRETRSEQGVGLAAGHAEECAQRAAAAALTRGVDEGSRSRWPVGGIFRERPE